MSTRPATSPGATLENTRTYAAPSVQPTIRYGGGPLAAAHAARNSSGAGAGVAGQARLEDHRRPAASGRKQGHAMAVDRDGDAFGRLRLRGRGHGHGRKAYAETEQSESQPGAQHGGSMIPSSREAALRL